MSELTAEEAVGVVQQVIEGRLARQHGVTYPPEVAAEAVRLAVRYLHDEFLPGKAIKLLDQAGARVVVGGTLRGPSDDGQMPALPPTEVTVEVLRTVISERTQIPLTRLSENESKRLMALEKRLHARVKGQSEAIRFLVQVVKRARAGLADPKRPLGVFLFAGPTGVGKTELALTLAEALFDQQQAYLRLDMSEYLERHQISRLIGAPPGYVGHGEEGQLTGWLRRRPYSVVLFDEIEKAHKEVQHLFLQLFGSGRLTDARGNVVDGRNAIFILTTNLGVRSKAGFQNDDSQLSGAITSAVKQHFVPEFLGRLDRTICFRWLDEEALIQIFDRLLDEASARLRERGITLRCTFPNE